MLRRFWSVETGIFLGIWLVLMIFGRSALLRDPGTFWHPMVGEHMIQTDRVIHADPFSFTRLGQPWTAHQWLSEICMAIVHRLGGFDALLTVTVSLLAGVYTWLASRMLRAGFHLLPVGLLTALVLLASSHQFHVRPLVVSQALFGYTFALLVDIEAGRQPLTRLWRFVIVVILWSNLHAGVLAGIATVGLCVAGWCLAGLLGHRQSPVQGRRDVGRMAALTAACLLAVLANPYGLGLPRAWLNTLAMPLPGLLQEHAPIDLRHPLGWTTVALGVGYLVALLGVLPRRPRVTWLIPLVWFVLACQRVRNVPMFAITVALVLADMLPHTRWAKWLEGREMFLPPDGSRRLKPEPMNWRPAVIPVVLVTVALSLQIAGVSAPVVGRGWARFDPRLWPVELLAELRDIDRKSAQSTPIFNDLTFGGFLIYHAPRMRVFVDDRCALYGSDFLTAYDHARRWQPDQLEQWQRQYDFRHALVATGANFDRYLDDAPEWVAVRRTPAATLYRRERTKRSIP